MKASITAIFACLLFSFACFGQTTRRALFLGNSYTYFNNMPQMVATIADGLGDSLIFDMYAPGGYTLDDHGTDPVSEAKIMQGNWDYLALQEQSQIPAIPGYWSNELSGINSLFRTHNPCGRLMFYMTWGRKNGDANNCQAFPNMCTYIGMDTQIRKTYIEMAQVYGGELSPVGAAWRYVRQNHPNIDLYNPDESHPSQAGSYLAACCFYAAIFKKDPTLSIYNYVLTPAVASVLRQAAKQVVYDSLFYWDLAPTVPTADFTFTIDNGVNEVNFVSYSSEFTDAYLWDFGDGTTSTLEYPTKNYANNGTYTVTLTVTNCDIDTTYTDTMQATVTFCPFTPTIIPDSLWLCPGVADSLWTQAYSAYQWYDAYTGDPIPGATNQYIPCTGSNAYSVKATQNGCTELSQPVTVYTHNNMVIWNMVALSNFIGVDTACIGETVSLQLWFNKPPFPDDQYIDWELNGQPLTVHDDSLWITNSVSGVYKATVRHPYCSSLDKSEERTITFVPCPSGVNNTPEPPLVSVFPNPSNGLFTLECHEPVKATVYDMYGRTIAAGEYPKGPQTIDLRNQPPGVYLLSVVGGGVRYGVRLMRR